MRQFPYNILFTKGHIFLEKGMKGHGRVLSFTMVKGLMNRENLGFIVREYRKKDIHVIVLYSLEGSD